jgi:hypothetical protein
VCGELGLLTHSTAAGAEPTGPLVRSGSVRRFGTFPTACGQDVHEGLHRVKHQSDGFAGLCRAEPTAARSRRVLTTTFDVRVRNLSTGHAAAVGFRSATL